MHWTLICAKHKTWFLLQIVDIASEFKEIPFEMDRSRENFFMDGADPRMECKDFIPKCNKML